MISEGCLLSTEFRAISRCRFVFIFLAFAASAGRVMVAQDDDFLRLGEMLRWLVLVHNLLLSEGDGWQSRILMKRTCCGPIRIVAAPNASTSKDLSLKGNFRP